MTNTNISDNNLLQSVETESEKIYNQISEKIVDLESKLTSLKRKEDILNEFIAKAQDELSQTEARNFKLRGQLQLSIMRQIGLLNELIDAQVKLEKLIQDYRKMQHDIQNSKIVNYAKWKAINQENADEQKLLEVIKKFEEAASGMLSAEGLGDAIEEQKKIAGRANALPEQILNATFEEGYDLK